MSVDYTEFFEEHKGVRAYSYEQFWDEIYENAYFDFDEARITIQKRDLRNKETMLFREHLAQRLMSGYISMDSLI